MLQESDNKKHRKKMLRKMDKLVGTVAQHARRYRQILDEQWDKTQWTRPQVRASSAALRQRARSIAGGP